MCGGSLFLNFLNVDNPNCKKCAQILILESGQYNLRECPLVEAPDSVKNDLLQLTSARRYCDQASLFAQLGWLVC